MNITVEKLPNCTANVRVEIPGEKHVATRNSIVANYVKHSSLPGFRRGKAPRSVVEKRYSDEITKEVTDRLVNEGLQEAVKQEKLNVLNVGGYKPEEGTDSFAFSLQVILAPEFEMPDYKGLTFTVPKLEVTDESVDKVLEEQREQFATLKDLTGRPAAMGDFVTVDYTATLDGEPLKDKLPEAESFIAENTGFLLKLTEENFVPGFCAQLAGISTGETREVKVTMPEEGLNDIIAGKEVVYSVTAGEMKEADLPELNDEFAGKLVNGMSLEDIRKLIRENLERQLQQKDLEQKRIAAMAALREKIDFTLPENVVLGAARQRVNQLVKMNLDRGVPQEMIQENEDDIVNAAKEQAKIDVKDEFLLMEIVKAEKLQPTNAELTNRIVAIAQNAKTKPEKVLKAMQKDKGAGLDNLKHSIVLAKALDVMVNAATIEYGGTASPEELSAE